MPIIRSPVTSSEFDGELTVSNGWIQWRKSPMDPWRQLISVSELSGSPNVIDVGTVTTLAAGQPAQAEIVGDSPSQVLNLWLPAGNNGSNGTDGRGIASTTVNYQSSSSGVTAPTGTWHTSVQSVTKGQFLWSRIVVSFTDGTTSTAYSVGYQGSDGAAGSNYSPGSPVARTITVGTAYQHTDTTKPFRVTVNARATQSVTVAGAVADTLELRIGPTQASVAAGGSGGFSVGLWESGITGIALMVGAGVRDGAPMFGDLPAGWWFSVNRLAGSNATVVSCFTQSMS